MKHLVLTKDHLRILFLPCCTPCGGLPVRKFLKGPSSVHLISGDAQDQTDSSFLEKFLSTSWQLGKRLENGVTIPVL